jgi:serine/threonine-protein kinase
MEPVGSDRLKSIFLRAAEVEGPEREGVLAAECGDDAALRARVEGLLAHHDETGSMEILPKVMEGGYAPSLATGRLVSKRFRIRRFIGKGGMGEVYEASDEELGGVVALKIILPGLIENEEMLARFKREVHLARQVTHPNVCRIFDVGRERAGGVELLYLTMELIDGETLTEYMKHEKKLRPADALPLLEQIAAGLGALHEKSIVHRDLKPSNVMLVKQSGGAVRAVIGDFGLARAVLEESLEDGLSRSGLVMGTPGYMAPEQLGGLRVSPATDVYAFGVLAYEMVTGKRAFPARHGTTPPPAPREVAPDVPADWEAVILRCLETDPSLRPETAAKAAAILAGQTRLATLPVAREEKKSRRGWLIGGGVALLAMAGAVAYWPGAAKVVGGGGGVNGVYLEAAGLLEHAYRPGATEKAIQLLEPVSQGPQATALVHAGLARAYFRQYRVTRVTTWLEKAQQAAARSVEMDGRLAAGHAILGRLYAQTGKMDLAAQELEEALRLDARNADAYMAQAELAEKQGRLDQVEPNLQKAVDLAPEYWSAHATLGVHYLAKNRFREARTEIEKLLELAPDNPAAYNYLGILNSREWRLEEARKAYEKEIQLAPTAAAYSNLGLVLRDSGEYREAEKAILKAIDLNPGDYRIWGHLASIYRWSPDMKEKGAAAYARAIEIAQKVRKASPSDVEVLASLGRYYASIGDRKNSVPMLRQAMALDSGSPTILMDLASSYEAIGQREEALRLVKMGLQLGLARERVERSPELALLRKDPRFTWTKQ